LKYFAFSKFWQRFDQLPANIQGLARENLALLKQNPSHPSLQFKRIKNSELYSVRISLGYRALGIVVDQGIQWFWISSHAEYDKLIR
jgi:hypothetical protein